MYYKIVAYESEHSPEKHPEKNRDHGREGNILLQDNGVADPANVPVHSLEK